jgi:hypothetical protein
MRSKRLLVDSGVPVPKTQTVRSVGPQIATGMNGAAIALQQPPQLLRSVLVGSGAWEEGSVL